MALSSACTADARLITPVDANAIVHLFNFIWFLLLVFLVRDLGRYNRSVAQKGATERHHKKTANR
jgi:hypothetical protein